MIYVYIYIYIYMYPCKNQKKMGVSAKTATKQMANNGRCKKEAWQYRELGSAHGIVLGFLRGARMLTSIHSKVTASVGDCLDQGGIFRR